jgi:two-component system OmpR family sensor kinase/two-component system sensor histidine kinase BaeS
LFWTMMAAFALVIMLGICGMLGFFGLAFSGIWQPGPIRTALIEAQQAYVRALSDYYVANGDSWQGIEQRLELPPFVGLEHTTEYVVIDRSGRIVASNDHAFPMGAVVDARVFARGVPVEVSGRQVGTFIVQPEFGIQPPTGRPSNFAVSVLRSFLIAGLLLAGALFLLAVLFARWFTLPLRRMTSAAMSVAQGRMDVRVQSASIRELDDLAQAFNTMANSLSDADRQRRQMTADIAHELRTPLSIMRGRLEGLQDGVYQATPEEVERLLAETALLERLVEDLRVLALAEAGQLPLFIESIDPEDLLSHAAALFAKQSADQGVTLRVVAPALLPTVDVDPQRMTQVLANLISNALRYTPAGGTITLEAGVERNLPISESVLVSQDGGAQSRVVLRVHDTGQGIDADALPYIFDRFYRADRSRARVSGGTGLGLAITKQIVIAHGGTISAESTQRVGTTISIALPATREGTSNL